MGAAALGPLALLAAAYGSMEHVRKTQDESIGRQLTHPGLTPQRILEEAQFKRRSEQALGGDIGGALGSYGLAATELMGGDFSNAFRRLRKDDPITKSITKLFRSIF